MKKRIIISLRIIFCGILSAIFWIGIIRVIMLWYFEGAVSCDAGYYAYLERKNIMIPWVTAITAIRSIRAIAAVFVPTECD